MSKREKSVVSILFFLFVCSLVYIYFMPDAVVSQTKEYGSTHLIAKSRNWQSTIYLLKYEGKQYLVSGSGHIIEHKIRIKTWQDE